MAYELPVIEGPPVEIVEKLLEINGYIDARVAAYERLEDQLDMLYKDIDAGKFGEDAKTGTWYLHIKGIKDGNAKPADPAKLQDELNNLITIHHG